MGPVVCPETFHPVLEQNPQKWSKTGINRHGQGAEGPCDTEVCHEVYGKWVLCNSQQHTTSTTSTTSTHWATYAQSTLKNTHCMYAIHQLTSKSAVGVGVGVPGTQLCLIKNS